MSEEHPVTEGSAVPAVEILPAPNRKHEHVAVPAPAPAAAAPATSSPVAPPVLPVAAEPVGEAAPVRKVFGLALKRPRKPESEQPQAGEPTIGPESVDQRPADQAPTEPVPVWSMPASLDTLDTLDTALPAAPAAALPAEIAQPVAVGHPVDTAEEVRALRALLEASEAERAAAETRAAKAVAYAQQAQAAVQQGESRAQLLVDQARAEAQSLVERAETHARNAAQDSQDWRFRHREAESTISDLAASVANSERRLAELVTELEALREERDDLLTSLEAATRPDHSAQFS